MNSKLKTSGRFFQVFSFVSWNKVGKNWFGYFFFFQNSFDFAALLV